MRGKTYDVIIVGAGSAGCVLAARLSEDPRRSVLLLEAGQDYADIATLPEDIASGLDGATRSHDWGLHSEPDASGRTVRLPRGKLVGGCSATNALFALRGSPADYDEWAARGNEAVRAARLLARTKPLVNLTARALSPASQVADTDAPLAAAVLANVSTYHHPVGTCRMGPDPGGGDVVDPHGRVHGIDRLLVVDASIMPTIPAANTNVPTIMIAERCAAWLTNSVEASVHQPNALQRTRGSRCSPPGR